MSEDVFISVDLGTTSVKSFLLRGDGSVLKSYVDSISLVKDPSIRSVEQVLGEVRHKVLNSLKYVVRGFEGKVSGLTFSSYGYSLVCLDDDFQPISNIMTYLDGRAVREQDYLEGCGVELYRRTGCPPLFIYPIARLLWLKTRGKLEGISRVSFVKDYIIYLLSKSWYIDLGVASTTGLLNTHKLVWDDIALNLVGIDENKLPELIDGSKVLDYITLPELKLEKVPITLGSMDGALQNLAYSLYEGEAGMNLGSSAALRVMTNEVVLDRSERMRLYHYYLADGYRVTGAIFNNGMSALDWFKDVVGGGDWEVITGGLREGASCRDGIYVLPFALGETLPFRDPYMKFTVLGLTLGNERGALFKAVFEGLGYLFKETVKALSDNGIEVKEVHCGGGGCLIKGIVEVISNVMCKPIVTYREEVSRGASALGALATLLRGLNYVGSLREVRFDVVNEFRSNIIIPSQSLCRVYDECYADYLEVVEFASKLYKKLFKTS
ncbi:MAG: FGGY family carbohydrate kinase [Sulfolobales archaeon]